MPTTQEKRWKLGNKRFNTGALGVSRTGELTVRSGGRAVSVPALARKYGTPLELFMPDVMSERVRTVIGSFRAEMKKRRYSGAFTYHYPMKVNQRKEFVKAALEGGAQIETSSANELELVRRMIARKEAPKSLHIHCNGPKTDEYLALIKRMHRAGYWIVPIIEDAHELAMLAHYPGTLGIRVDLDVKIKSHWDKKFNRFGFRESELRALPSMQNLSILSYHLSSQIEGTDGFTKPISQAMKLYADLKRLHPSLSTLNIGGGAGVPYIKSAFYTTEELVKAIVATAAKESARYKVAAPNLMCEWGRHVAAPAQITVFKVIASKSVAKGVRTKWYVIDGSFIANLPDTWSLHQRWHIIPANAMHSKRMESAWFAGSSCDSDDEYVPERGGVPMPAMTEGSEQYVAVLDTGAYQDSLASYHCLLSRPARVSINAGTTRLSKQKQSSADVGTLFGW